MLLDILTDIDVILMIDKGIRRGMCYAIPQYVKAINKYMKDCEKYRKYTFIISYVLKREHFLWMSNVTKVTCTRF